MSCLFDSMYSLLSQHGIYFESSHTYSAPKLQTLCVKIPQYSLESGTVERVGQTHGRRHEYQFYLLYTWYDHLHLHGVARWKWR